MIVFLPLSTDAPVYHFPYGTIGLVVINCLVHALQVEGILTEEQVLAYCLQFGLVNPVQWLTWIFLHIDIFHLIGNMIVLWSFGLIVEGKLGLVAFMGLYLGLGAVQGAATQLCCLGFTPDPFAEHVPCALGASGAIYGLMAISLVWAPRNELSCLLIILAIFRFFVRMIEVTVYTFAFWFILIDFTIAFFIGFQMSTQVLHITGAGLGFVAGVSLLKAKLVDCENWDIFTVWKGDHLLSYRGDMDRAQGALPVPRRTRASEADLSNNDKPAINRATKKAEPKALSQEQAAARLEYLSEKLDQGEVRTAHKEYQKLRALPDAPLIPEKDLFRLAEQLYRGGLQLEAIPVLERCVALVPDKSHKLRVLLAELQLMRQERPQAALRTLEGIEARRIDSRWKDRAQQIAMRAQATLEGEDLAAPEDWGDPLY